MYKELAEIEKQLKQLEQERKNLLQIQENELRKKNWDELSLQIQTYPIENMMSIELEECTKTIPVFEEFKQSNKQFLLLKNIGVFFINKGKKYMAASLFEPAREVDDYESNWVSLIVCKNWKKLYAYHTNITPTKLKKANGLYSSASINNPIKINNYTHSQTEKSDPTFKLLWQQLNEKPFSFFAKSAQDNTPIKQKTIPFSTPIKIGAQILENREGYGNIYCGEELISKGTEYGETTPFLIAGCVIHTDRL